MLSREWTFLAVIAMIGWLAFCEAVPGWAEDQHGVQAIVSAMTSPIPDDVIAQARASDDRLMSSGAIGGTKVYLVTDDRSQRVNNIVRRLLIAMGQEDHGWLVRVLDTNPPTINAFTTGGKYIYTFTGFLKEATSEDEIAFVLSHELGHSLLKHNIRRKEDPLNSMADLADLIAGLAAKKSSEKVKSVTGAVRASYSRVDEQEADAIGVAIAWRAGFDPLRGADFFSRGVRRTSDEQEKASQQLSQVGADTQRAMALYQQWRAAAQANPFNRNQAQMICNEAEQKRVRYNQAVAQQNQKTSPKHLATLYSTHPNDQSRIAAVAALTDYIQGRRPLDSLQQFGQSYRVMTALKEIDSVLMKRPPKGEVQRRSAGDPPRAAGKTMAEQLQQLKQALDQGLVSEDEYQTKRRQILERF